MWRDGSRLGLLIDDAGTPGPDGSDPPKNARHRRRLVRTMSPDGWQARADRHEESGMSAGANKRPSDETIVRPATRTFFGAPPADSLDRLDAQVAFLGVPWDQGVIIPFIRSGAYAGPRLVRETRTRLRDTLPDGTS